MSDSNGSTAVQDPLQGKHDYELPIPEEDNYVAQYGIILLCDNEEDQKRKFYLLKETLPEDAKLRVLTV